MKNPSSKTVPVKASDRGVAFPGLNYDITRFARIFRVGNGYWVLWYKYRKKHVSPRTRKPTDLSGFWLNIYIYNIY